VIRGLVRNADRKALVSSQKAAGKATQRAHHESPDDGVSVPVATERKAAGCSDGLMRRLSAHRTVGLQVMLARNAPVALAALAHVFVQRVFEDGYRRTGSALQITPQLSAHALQTVADDLKQSPAWEVLEAAKLAWKERLPEHPSTWLAWLIALPQAELLDLLAFCTATTLNALPSSGAASEANAVAAAVGLDMADWWEPTAAGYLNHVSKAQIVQALKEVGPDSADDGVAAMKMEVLVVKAESRLAGKRWLPAPLRHPPG
jgi:ParB family transcriptional regulator, chromosome partitioning protein